MTSIVGDARQLRLQCVQFCQLTCKLPPENPDLVRHLPLSARCRLSQTTNECATISWRPTD